MKLFATVTAAIFLVACAANDSSAQRDDFRLILERGPCFGSCPVYRLQVLGTGEVTFEGARFTAYDGRTARKQLTTDEIDALISSLADANYFHNLEEQCERRATDQSSFKMDVTYDGQQGAASRYLGCLSASSDSIVLFAKVVDDIVGTAEWTSPEPMKPKKPN